MKNLKTMFGCMALCLILPTMAQPADDVWYAWSPRPDKLPAYAQNRPITRLPTVLARHKGEQRWQEQVIRTARYDARWIQATPGDKTPTIYYGDDRVVWVVWGGQIRFTIQGQQPFVATKGFLVQVPQRVRFSMETVGNIPSLRFEVRHAGILPIYAGDQPKPADPAGSHYIKISTPTQPASYDQNNRPYLDFFKDVVAADPVGKQHSYHFVADEANAVNVIRGPGVPTLPASNKGHFHIGDDEFWFVPEGRIDYLIEGVRPLTANAGDIVYAAPGRFHRASRADGQVDTCIAFNVSPNLFHNFGADAGGKQ